MAAGYRRVTDLPELWRAIPTVGFNSDKPIIALQHIGRDWRTRNLGEFAEEVGRLEEFVHSGTDWLHLFALERAKDLGHWQATRVETLRSSAIAVSR